MNPITCGMAADLLPLYLDGCCSADSRAALEAHMDACPACRAQYAQLRRDLTPAAPAAEDPGTDGIARALARKMRRRKRCLRALGAVLGVLLAVLLVFIGKTFVILGQPGGAASAGLPAGATDLAAREVSGTAEEVGAYVFATGTARLVVSADALPDVPVTVRLWQVRETRRKHHGRNLGRKAPVMHLHESAAADALCRHCGRRAGCAAHRAQPAHVPGGVFPHAAGAVSRDGNRTEIGKPRRKTGGAFGVLRKERNRISISAAGRISRAASPRARGRTRCVCGVRGSARGCAYAAPCTCGFPRRPRTGTDRRRRGSCP